jgi:formate hydrogenlyase subunit 4
MLAAAGSAFATLLHAALFLAAAPLLAGLVGSLRAASLGRRGPPPLQPYVHLRRLLAKAALAPDTATDAFPAWPFVAFAAMLTAGVIVPGFSTGLLTAPLSDLIVIIGLTALARAATILAAMESGAAFGGAAAAREALFSVFAEGAALVALLTFALITGATRVEAIADSLRGTSPVLSVSLGFTLVALLAVALTESGRLPADNPAGHLELGMVHEGLTLEYSGRYLALFDYAAMLRLLLWMDLIGTIFFPFGMAQGAAPLSWPLGLILWAGKLAVMAAALAAFEVSRAKMRVFRVPEFLGLAMLLGVLASLFLFVAASVTG